MQLDLYKNELIFKQVQHPSKFMLLLQQAKGLQYRHVQDTFYIPIAHLEAARMVLAPIRSELKLTPRYLKFAERFLTSKELIHIDWFPAQCTMRGSGVPWGEIIKATSFFNKAALNSKAYETKRWDGNTHLFDAVTGTFPSGLVERITTILNAQGLLYTITRHFDYPAPEHTWIPTFAFEPTKDQMDAVNALDVANNGIAKLPTGFGKTSYVAAALIAKKGVRSLFLANQRVLINDAKRDFAGVFGDQVQVGVIGDGEFDPQLITVASIQGIVAGLTLPSTLEWREATNEEKICLQRFETDPSKENKAALTRAKNKVKKMTDRTDRHTHLVLYLQSVELFIVDESQVLGTDMWQTFLDACPAPYRYTLSATDTRTDGGRILIVAATGERRFQSSAADQIAKQRLAEFKAIFGKFDHGVPPEVLKQVQVDYHQAYDVFIVNNELRNRHLCEQVLIYKSEGHAVIALITIIRHAEMIRDMLITMGVPEDQMAIVSGQTPKKQRNDAIERFRSGEIPILIGSSIFDVGFNAKNASRMVRFNAGGSEIRETQRAGRTVRMRDDASHGEMYDLIDMNAPFFQSQSWKRIKLLKDEFGRERVQVLGRVIKGETNYASLHVVTEKQSGQMNLSEFIDLNSTAKPPAIEVSREILDLLDEFS